MFLAFHRIVLDVTPPQSPLGIATPLNITELYSGEH